jgi:hypothetical protein
MVCWIARALVGDVPTLWPIRARRAQSDPKVYSSAAASDGDSVGRARPGLVTAVRQRDLASPAAAAADTLSVDGHGGDHLALHPRGTHGAQIEPDVGGTSGGRDPNDAGVGLRLRLSREVDPAALTWHEARASEDTTILSDGDASVLDAPLQGQATNAGASHPARLIDDLPDPCTR